MSDRRSTTVNLFSKDAVVLIEGSTTLTLGGKEAVLHWTTVLEFNAEGHIAEQRDYWDSQPR